jgi:D-alanyl-D-alanine endopeptidase (penicillin-binding protein 7)
MKINFKLSDIPMLKFSSFLVSIFVLAALVFGSVESVGAKSVDQTSVKKNEHTEKNRTSKDSKSSKDNKSVKPTVSSTSSKATPVNDKNKKNVKSPKNPREVRTTVMPRSTANQAPARPRVSLGTAMGLNKQSDELNLKSNVSIVVDQQAQEVLFEKNPQVVLPIASITKLLMAMTVLDAKLPMDEELEINDEDAAIYNHSRLLKGTVLTRQEALLLALMSSENRAAYTLGRNYPGGIRAFMAAMNRKAQAIGMTHSSFEDPTGLTSKNVSTAEELAILVSNAYQYPLIRQFTTTPNHVKEINHREQTFLNSNRLVRSGDMEIVIQKTGYISEAGRCLVMMAIVNNKPYTMVFLDSVASQSRFADAVRVKEWLEGIDQKEPIRKLSNLKPVVGTVAK